jgi:hypothetical protein
MLEAANVTIRRSKNRNLGDMTRHGESALLFLIDRDNNNAVIVMTAASAHAQSVRPHDRQVRGYANSFQSTPPQTVSQ